MCSKTPVQTPRSHLSSTYHPKFGSTVEGLGSTVGGRLCDNTRHFLSDLDSRTGGKIIFDDSPTGRETTNMRPHILHISVDISVVRQTAHPVDFQRSHVIVLVSACCWLLLFLLFTYVCRGRFCPRPASSHLGSRAWFGNGGPGLHCLGPDSRPGCCVADGQLAASTPAMMKH